MQEQDKGEIPVDPSYSSTSCSSALLASASLDKHIVTQKKERKHKR